MANRRVSWHCWLYSYGWNNLLHKSHRTSLTAVTQCILQEDNASWLPASRECWIQQSPMLHTCSLTKGFICAVIWGSFSPHLSQENPIAVSYKCRNLDPCSSSWTQPCLNCCCQLNEPWDTWAADRGSRQVTQLDARKYRCSCHRSAPWCWTSLGTAIHP